MIGIKPTHRGQVAKQLLPKVIGHKLGTVTTCQEGILEGFG
jgi:hypothetical protein